MVDRNRPSRTYTLDPEVAAYLDQKHINASRLIDAAIRDKVSETAIEAAAVAAGVYSDEEDEDR